ncbi:type IV pilus assembly protein PilM [Butyrivibrio fibrisolvens DSM 3071]|uniref:Type IV pilus assembly protein PilM n=1 Tax=Butyrivibrio fibrisolvens DSM 3071 TaxID=1121131 RepID=A0A1M6EM38_BUTFI|nr:pilus assembly protein PilM [Butyrivibrio fibrisolvens]SHI86625.1 type IV pilus assembly protein PilM [Butyrivibrio fibrisolvens DSM 3071]
MAKVLSIEIGTTLTEIVEMDYKVRNPKVYKSLMISTPEGVLDEGMLYGYEHFADALKKMIKSKGFKAKKAIFSISSNRIASREVEIPYLKENQIRDYVLANATDYFPVDITEYNISYSILEHLQNEDGGKAIRINALAVPNELLESYREFAKEAGLELEAIDYDGNSLYQAVKKECGVGSQIVIKIDEKSTIVTVMKDGVQSLTRTVPYGIEEAVDTIIYSHIYSDNTSHSEAISYLRTVKCVNPAFDMEAYRKAKAEEKAKALAEAQAQAAGEGGDSDSQDGAGQNIDGFGQGMDFFGFNGDGSESDGSGISPDGSDAFGSSGADSGSSDAFGSGADGSGDAFGGSGTDSGNSVAFGSGTADSGSYSSAGAMSMDGSAGSGVAVIEDEEEDVSPQLLEIREHVTFSFENLVSGLSTVLDLYYSRTKGQKIDRVLLTGIGGTIQGMDELITNTLDVPAQQIRSLEGIQLGKVFKSGIFGEYIGCIGATIKPVDFLIKEKKVKNAGTDIVSIGRLVFIGCVGASVVMLAMSLPPYLDASNTNKTLRSQLQSVVSIIPIYQKYTLSKQAYEFVNDAYSQKDEPVAHIVEFLEEMEEKMPADVLVSTINSDNDSISITMSVSTKEEAADVYQQFCTFKSLEYVTIENLTDETTDAGDGLVTFTLVGVYAEKSEEDVEGEEGEIDNTEETESVEAAEDGDVVFSSEDTSAEGSSVSGSGATDEDLGEEDAGDGSTDEELEESADGGTEESAADETSTD